MTPSHPAAMRAAAVVAEVAAASAGDVAALASAGHAAAAAVLFCCPLSACLPSWLAWREGLVAEWGDWGAGCPQVEDVAVRVAAGAVVVAGIEMGVACLWQQLWQK